MNRPRVLRAFSDSEYSRAYLLLATRVVDMMGRKLEEADWSEVYCLAKGIPTLGWSNLNIDIMHHGMGIEQKMLCYRSNTTLRDACGTTLIHPSATRSIRILSTEGDPNEVMKDVLDQYVHLIEERRAVVKSTAPEAEPEVRTGWLLWQQTLREFLYFEEEMLQPDPRDYWAEWKESGGRGRKASRNLWVYEKDTGRKRYSITTSAGAKIQPYFDVPPSDNPFLYFFVVQGLDLGNGYVRVWVASSTARELKDLVGSLGSDELSSAILAAAEEASVQSTALEQEPELAYELMISRKAYDVMKQTWGGISDEHAMRMFLRSARKTG